MMKKPRHALKDSVFKNLFGDKKYLLELYSALHPEDTNVTQDDINDVTINPVLMDSEYNDLGFSVRDKLIALVESQSTWSMNIIVRALLYLINTYHDYFKRTKQNLYSSKKVIMPVPELYVIYTGTKKNIPESISLKKEFFNEQNSAIDATVKILSNGRNNNIIGAYISFCKVYDEQIKTHGRTQKAIEETIHICKDKNILYEYLKEREAEVIDIMMTLFSDDQLALAYDAEKEREITERVEREKAAALRENTIKVKRENSIQLANKLLIMGTMSIDDIAKLTELSVEDVSALNKNV